MDPIFTHFTTSRHRPGKAQPRRRGDRIAALLGLPEILPADDWAI